jgi:ABC-type sugar transport system permease subunit
MTRRYLSLEKKQSIVGYLFVLPITTGIILLFFSMMIQSFLFSVSDIKVGSDGFELTYIGFRNYYRAFFVDKDYVKNVVGSIKDMAINVPVIVIFSFFIANVLNQKFVGRTTARVVFFIPVIIATGVIGAAESADMMLSLYQNSAGEINAGVGQSMFGYRQFIEFLENSGLNQGLVDIVTGSIDTLYTIITSSGVPLLIFLAGLQSIPPSMYEAAKVEGASGWEVFWKISFPYISPLILLNIVYTVIDNFFSFRNGIINMIMGLVRNPTQYSWATSLAWIYMLIVIVFLALITVIAKKFVVYQD